MIDLRAARPPSQLPDVNLQSLYALSQSVPAGDFVEVGVYKGGSAWVLDQSAFTRDNCTLHLFDTFSGIPHKGELDSVNVGEFKDVDLDELRALIPSAEFYVGVFPNTLGEEPEQIAFAHIDCDQYDGCHAAITCLWPRIVPGGIMAFDDYPFAGIKKAIHDFFGDAVQFTKTNIPYVRKGAG